MVDNEFVRQSLPAGFDRLTASQWPCGLPSHHWTYSGLPLLYETNYEDTLGWLFACFSFGFDIDVWRSGLDTALHNQVRPGSDLLFGRGVCPPFSLAYFALIHWV